MESDFGVSKTLHELPQDKQEDVVDCVKQLGVKVEDDLKAITVEDLMENDLLSKVQARRLLKHWQRGRTSGEDQSARYGGGKNVQTITGNTGPVTATGRDHNITNHNNGPQNKYNAAVNQVNQGQQGGTANNHNDPTHGRRVQEKQSMTGEVDITNKETAQTSSSASHSNNVTEVDYTESPTKDKLSSQKPSSPPRSTPESDESGTQNIIPNNQDLPNENVGSKEKITVMEKHDLGALNDNGINVDRLGHDLYAKALAHQIKIIKPPLTIGLFASWGSGKSFLLQHVQNIVSSEAGSHNQHNKYRKIIATCSWMFYLLFVAVVVLLPILFFVVFRKNVLTVSLICLVADLLVISLLLFFSTALRGFSKILLYAIFTKLPIKPNLSSFVHSTIPNGFFPIQKGQDNKRESDGKKKDSRYIFVEYNAWKYAGCDVLWAGIVNALAKKVEEEFGKLTTRLFRSLNLEAIPKPALERHLCVKCSTKSEDEIRTNLKEYGLIIKLRSLEKWETENKINIGLNKDDKCWIVEYSTHEEAKSAFEKLQHSEVYVACLLKHCTFEHQAATSFRQHMKKHPRINRILISVGVLGAILCSIIIITISFDSNIPWPGDIDGSTEDIILKVIGILPVGTTALIFAVKLAYAFYNSQENRIGSALKSNKKKFANELGFMNKIKEEVDAIIHLIKAIEFMYNIRYKVVITIDDLDRVPLEKVKSVLESVNILLSDRLSPFICIIAIDSRVAMNCFAIKSESKKDQPITNGHEYIKKIINLPYCLPEIDDSVKSDYVDGLMEELVTTLDPLDLEEVKIVSTRQDVSTEESAGSSSSPVNKPTDEENCDGSNNNVSTVESAGSSSSPVNKPTDEENRDGSNNNVSREESAGSSSSPVNKPTDEENRDGSNTNVSPKEPAVDPSSPLLTNEEYPDRSNNDVSTEESAGSSSSPVNNPTDEENRDGSNNNVSREESAGSSSSPVNKPTDEENRDGSNTNVSREESAGSSSSPVNKPTDEENRDGSNTNVSREESAGSSSSPVNKSTDEENRDGSNNSGNDAAASTSNQEAKRDLEFKKFLSTCRDLMREDRTLIEHMHGNPRSIKRIFNIISVTALLINLTREKKKLNRPLDKDFAKELLYWIFLTDQWPFRMSYLLVIIADADRRKSAGFETEKIEDSKSLWDLYTEYILGKEKAEVKEHLELSCLDDDLDVLESLLVHSKGFIKKGKAMELQKYTINLDGNVKKAIALKRYRPLI